MAPAPRGPPERSANGAERKVPRLTAGAGGFTELRRLLGTTSKRCFGNTVGPSSTPVGGSYTGLPVTGGTGVPVGAATGAGAGVETGSPACLTGGPSATVGVVPGAGSFRLSPG